MCSCCSCHSLPGVVRRASPALTSCRALENNRPCPSPGQQSRSALTAKAWVSLPWGERAPQGSTVQLALEAWVWVSRPQGLESRKAEQVKMCGQRGTLWVTVWHTAASMTRCSLCFVLLTVLVCVFYFEGRLQEWRGIYHSYEWNGGTLCETHKNQKVINKSRSIKNFKYSLTCFSSFCFVITQKNNIKRFHVWNYSSYFQAIKSVIHQIKQTRALIHFLTQFISQ